MTIERLISALARLIHDNNLHATNREDTYGVLMRCGVFHDSDDEGYIVKLGDAIDQRIKELYP
jgi:hypothetical protein